MANARNLSNIAPGVSTAGILSGGYGGLGGSVSPTTAGNVLFTADGSVWSSTQKIFRDTLQTPTSGTAVQFTSIPSWVKRITMLLNQISTNGTAGVLIQIGSGSYTSTGYAGTTVFTSSSNVTGAAAGNTNGFLVGGLPAIGSTISAVCTMYNITGNIWMYEALATRANGTTAQNGTQTTVYVPLTLSGALDRVQLASVNGTDTFDAGSVNILYE